MKAVLVRSPGGREHLYIGVVPQPEPSEEEVLVRVRATALNRADILQREGKYPPPPGASSILGLEMAGEVVRTGKRVQRWKPGDRVFGLLPGGGYAQYAVIHEQLAMPIPENLSFEEAAAIPEAFLTAYQALYWLGGFSSGRRVLIHAGASGVGTAAIQLVREGGGEALITAGSQKKIAFCLELGARYGFNYREGPFAPHILRVTDEEGVHTVIDFIGAPYWEANLQVLALEGTLVMLSTLGGSVVNRVDLRQLFRKWAHITASTLRNRPLAYKIRLTREFEERMLPLFREGRLRPVIYRILPWTEVAEAHRIMEMRENIGKIVLRVLD